MPRFYLILFFCWVSGTVFCQKDLQNYLQFADEQYKKGDYIYALDYYEKALEIDSNSVAILWKYAETLRAYKDYPKAAFYYEKVYSKEEAGIYPYSMLQWALMEKQTGNYATAIELFKRAKKKYARDKKGYLYLKSKRELESCLWAQSAQKDTTELNPVSLPAGLNTSNSEFGHGFADSLFYFSSLRADSIGAAEEIYDVNYTNRLYTFPFFDTTSRHEEVIEPLNEKGINTGNGTFSLDGKRFYFSKCTSADQQFNCRIAVSRYENGKWKPGEVLGEIVNTPGANTTMPHIARIENDEVLFFSSIHEKEKGGGMDLFFVPVKNDGNQFGKVKEVPMVNSPDNELSPWYSESEKRLYFSSSWWDGFGGYDVFYSPYLNGTFTEPVNAGLPINSPANDLYYFSTGDTAFVSSNRLGVLYAKNPTCCSDIFAFAPPVITVPETKKETLEDLNKRLPVTLYFHNDVPGPRNYEVVTPVDYATTYYEYIAMIPEYRKEYAKGLDAVKSAEAEEDIESFFTEFVEQGLKDLTQFKSLLLEELEKGVRIRLNVRGFASPLAKTDYNVALTKRRINSLLNYLKTCDYGAFAPYLDGTAANGGRLEVAGLPFGEYTADQVTSDNPNDVKNSVFSRAAARERKIEIQSVSYLDTDSLSFLVESDPASLILGKIIVTDTLTRTLTIRNTGTHPLTIVHIESKDSLFTVQSGTVVPAKGQLMLSVTPAKTLPSGLFSIPLDLYFEGIEKPFRVMILGEGTN